MSDFKSVNKRMDGLIISHCNGVLSAMYVHSFLSYLLLNPIPHPSPAQRSWRAAGVGGWGGGEWGWEVEYIGFTPSVCLSVRPVRMRYPLCNAYISGWILFILGTNDHYHERMCRSQWPLILTYTPPKKVLGHLWLPLLFPVIVMIFSEALSRINQWGKFCWEEHVPYYEFQ